MRIHIIDDWLDTLRHLPCFQRLNGHDVTIWTRHEADPVRLAQQIEDAEVLIPIRERTRISDELVSRLPRLKLVSSIGHYPNIDVEALARRGILFCSKLEKNPNSTATGELAFTLILAGLRDLRNQMDGLRAGRWQSSVGRSLRGLRLGLLGYGAVARQVAGYARAFGMDVVWWTSDPGRARAVADGEPVARSREAFFAESDVVSVHQRLTPETLGNITTRDFALMGPKSLFVNTARAALVQPGALLDALNAGRPQRAAMDVFDIEPVTHTGDALINHPRVIATPHIGFMTEEVLDMSFTEVFQQVLDFADGKPSNVVRVGRIAEIL